MIKSKTPITKIKSRALISMKKIDGKKEMSLARLFRRKDEGFVKLLQRRKSSSLNEEEKKRFKYKPLEKFIALPPSYKLGLLRPITPIKSSNDKKIVLDGKAGQLFVPKIKFPSKDEDKVQSFIESELLKRKIKELSSRIKLMTQKVNSPRTHRLKAKIKLYDSRCEEKEVRSSRSIHLSPTQESLLKKWDKVFDNY